MNWLLRFRQRTLVDKGLAKGREGIRDLVLRFHGLCICIIVIYFGTLLECYTFRHLLSGMPRGEFFEQLTTKSVHMAFLMGGKDAAAPVAEGRVALGGQVDEEDRVVEQVVQERVALVEDIAMNPIAVAINYSLDLD